MSGGGGGSGGGPGDKATSSASSATSGNSFGAALADGSNLIAVAVIAASVAMFLGLIVVASIFRNK